ncbi:transmembrane 6 superfamily member 1-like [Liolophura sinensis]|uniref:transmembrane 6 superfamily member 1-like n=1 Tax=Liolophura sinensis TaxID=3198878 RepID=UPI0031596CB1
MGVSTMWAVALPISLTGIPIAYVLNKTGAMEQQFFVLVAGVVCLALVAIIPAAMMIIRGEKNDPFFYVLSIFTFSSVMDLVIALENDGFISSFMTFYLLEGEPYLVTAHGTMILYWDGIAHLLMYVLMVAGHSKRQGWYREVGLYWAGSIAHSMVVFLPGNIAGKYGMKWSILLNVPYLIIPFWAGYRFLKSGVKPQKSVSKPLSVALWKRPQDVFFVLYLLAATALAAFRGMTVLGCNAEMSQIYKNQYDPYLKDDSTYPMMQMLIYLFYFIPYYVAAACGLWGGENHTWMTDWALIHAGAAAQGQFSYIGGAIHASTDPNYRLPSDPSVRLSFFLINGALFLVPQLMALRFVWGKTFTHELPPAEPILSQRKKKAFKKHM